MPLFLVRVSRLVEVVETGDFSIEAADADEAGEKAKEALASQVTINWDELDRERSDEHPIKIQEVEILANGTEDITEHF